MFIFPLLNIYILISSYFFVKRFGNRPVSETVVSVFVIYAGQIVITEIILGTLGYLNIFYLTISNLLISSILIYFSQIHNIKNCFTNITNDRNRIVSFLISVYSPYNIFISSLLILLSIWITLAAYYLPPRGIDDITYHMTTIIEFIKHQKIFVLPVVYRPQVTMPLNAELLFMWPAIFYRNDYAFGLIQYLIGFIGVAAIYRFCMFMSVERKISFFVAQLFMLSPVVMAQSGTAYIDLILSVFFIVSLYYSTRYYIGREDYYLYLSALSIGLMVGMKYTSLLLAISLQVLIINSDLLKNKTKLAIYIVINIVSGGFWYIRNFIEFGSFTPFLSNILRREDSKIFLDVNINDMLNNFLFKTKELFLNDTGLNSLHGGYGIIFWGMALPSIVYFLIKSMKLSGRRKFVNIYIWLQIIPGFIFLYISPISRLYFRPRYSIFMIAIGMIALGNLIQQLKPFRLYRHIILLICSVFSVLSLIHLAIIEIPSYRIDLALNDRIYNKHDFSKMRYYLLAKTNLAYIWETLDYITLKYPDGLSVYISMTDKDYSTPVYGSKFNNRIWNFEKFKNRLPDAFIFRLSNNMEVKKYGNDFTFKEILLNNNYKLIDMSGSTFLFLDKGFLESDNVISRALTKHYDYYYSKDIDIIKNALAKLDKKTPIICSNYLGFVFTYFKLVGDGLNYNYTVPEKYIRDVVLHYKLSNFYTVAYIPQGYVSKIVETINIGGRNLNIYENRLE